MPKQKKFTKLQNFEKTNLKFNTSRRGLNLLKENGLISTSGDKGDEKAYLTMMLESLAISVDGLRQRDFSLKKITSDKEFVKNPNILETKDYKKIENEYDKPDDKFPNENDPFYQLDDARDNNEPNIDLKNNFLAIGGANIIAEQILELNLNSEVSIKQLRRFENG